MTDWEPIETAPKDGTLVPCCWAGDGDWMILRWKTNPRIKQSYFGDPNEDDDYEIADYQLTHWFDLPKVPE